LEKLITESLNIKPKRHITLIDIGSFIREARIIKNQSLDELASILKISEQQLIAIEEGKEELLPEKVFIKAMLKRISEKLNLDVNPMIEEYINQKSENDTELINENNLPKKKEINKIKLGFVIPLIISGITGLLLSSIMFNFFSNFQNESNKISLLKKF
tara:strand:+ start:691 stop:1167 length:477 start_codon:yes stop_codon:yes gene_type:complete